MILIWIKISDFNSYEQINTINVKVFIEILE